MAKEWEAHFEIVQVDEGDETKSIFLDKWKICSKKTGEKVTQRYYAFHEDARRGAAQIYNHMKKSLLG